MKTLSSIVLLVASCSCVVAEDPPTAVDAKDKLIVETVLRLKDFDLDSSAPAKAAVLRYLRAQPGTDPYFELIERFRPTEIAEELASFALQHANETSGVRGAELLFAMDSEPIIAAALNGEDEARAVAAVSLIGHAAGKKSVPMLLPKITDSLAPLAVRTTAVSALGRSTEGQRAILSLVTQGELAEGLKFAAANVLLSSPDTKIAREAGRYLELPATADSMPLPPLSELVERRGNVKSGEIVFRTIGTCINCHKVADEGKVVGPDLSEIGSKLSREAMFVSILDPSAAVSHNFETHLLLTDEGEAVKGLLVSETDTQITLRTTEGIDKIVDKDAIEEFRKQKQSLMPQDLQKLLTVEQLVDVVEYTLSLRTAEGATPQ